MWGRGRERGAPRLAPILLLALSLLPIPLAAQRPGEIAGRVVEAGTAAPLEMVAVEVPALGLRAWT
ncbi:MAG TPA: hypothetical protein VHG08_02285, partial [Longimicrobium sp.]|nr:hypothetical protein [Longimicrobium sp.]